MTRDTEARAKTFETVESVSFARESKLKVKSDGLDLVAVTAPRLPVIASTNSSL